MADFHSSAEKGHVWKNQRLQHGRREVEVVTLLLCNDKNNVITDKVLSYFYCLSSKFEVYIACNDGKYIK